jgi:hypothetical protein
MRSFLAVAAPHKRLAVSGILCVFTGVVGVACYQWRTDPIQHHLWGLVLSAGTPVEGFWLEFRTSGRAQSPPTLVSTDATGRYEVSLESIGDYTVGFFPRRTLPAGSVSLQLRRGEKRIDFEVPATALSLVLHDLDRHDAYQLRLHEVTDGLRASADLLGFVSASELHRPIVGLPRGRWRLFLDTRPDFVSVEPSDFDLTQQNVATIQATLEATVARISVVDLEGRPVGRGRFCCLLSFVLSASHRARSQMRCRVRPSCAGAQMMITATGIGE